ncbi:MAG TPA: transposase [Opitutaceae bacterium]|nr:transposase [Opitutaceae bacterium]
MREPRIKVLPEEAEAIYHCMSRTVNGEWLFKDADKEMLRRLIWLLAEFCGLELLTYTVMSNHFHVLVRVLLKGPISDEELLRRYRLLHPPETGRNVMRHEILRAQLAADTPYAVEWRRRMRRLMGDVSPFMKLLKQRFSIWFNKTHGRFGTLWAERFKSVLIEPSFDVVATVAAYIELNSVRAGVVADPKDYRFCGYAEAVAGTKKARRGIAGVLGPGTWDKLHAEYRMVLFTNGSAISKKTGAIALEALQRVLRQRGKLPLPEILRCRVRYFTQGAVLGSQVFVAEHLARLGKHTPPRPLPALTDWGDLAVLRNIRRPRFA